MTSVVGLWGLQSLTTGAAALDTAVGTLLALSVIVCLQRSRTGFRKTDNIINRIIIFSMSTGLATNILAVLCLAFVRILLLTVLTIDTGTGCRLTG